MHSNDFEKVFSDFLDRREYDQAENALFAMIRIAFIAGWRAAGGDPPSPQKIFQIIHKKDINSNGIDSDLCVPNEGDDPESKKCIVPTGADVIRRRG